MPTNDCPFTPFADWLIVVMTESREKIGSLYVPDTARDAPQSGEVVAVGPEVDEDGPNFGDHVLFAKYAGASVTWTDDREYLFVRAEDIIAKVTPIVQYLAVDILQPPAR